MSCARELMGNVVNRSRASQQKKKKTWQWKISNLLKKISASCLVCGGFCTFCSPEGTDIIPENNEFCAFPQEAFSSASDTETEK